MATKPPSGCGLVNSSRSPAGESSTLTLASTWWNSRPSCGPRRAARHSGRQEAWRNGLRSSGLLKLIDKSRQRGRRLPPDLYELSKQLSRVPQSERADALERALKAEREGTAGAGVNRQARRAAERQSRQSRR